MRIYVMRMNNVIFLNKHLIVAMCAKYDTIIIGLYSKIQNSVILSMI